MWKVLEPMPLMLGCKSLLEQGVSLLENKGSWSPMLC